ncbi:uncharacterized protein [Montipora capricornis]|uniref:uncharacterized protein isoform X3 n=1 Tax=Montipora capricornis TaxID=246305 RepID=UPI0035F1EFC6
MAYGWHMDGNHKLIRWRMVVHGAIDGYSRLVVFLHCSNNNRAETVLQLFMKAVTEFGLPSRLRTDKGGENTAAALYMLQHPLRGTGRGSVIAGSSTHNQRIERLWRDVYSGVLCLYQTLFYHLEEHGVLDPLNEVDLLALHTVFLPRINRHLDIWQGGWNNHSMRTARSLSPLQQFVSGMLQLRGSCLEVAREMFCQLDEKSLQLKVC